MFLNFRFTNLNFTKRTAVFLVFSFLANSIFAQRNAELENILSEAQKQTQIYRETFKNLLAEEIKTFEEFDKNGKLDEKTVVKSTFLVYQSGKDEKTTSELRNVLEVNGKAVPESQKRAEKLQAELEKTRTLESELLKIQEESLRFDKTWEIFGLTLNEAPILSPNLRPSFEFQMLGKENFQGRAVFLIAYRQTKPSPFITINGKEKKPQEESLNFDFDIPKEIKKEQISLNGKFWIDAETFQIRREERELTANQTKPLVLLSTVFEYADSEFGILVPKNISLIFYKVKKQKKSEELFAVKDSAVMFEYSKFRKANVEVIVLDDDEEGK